MTEQGRLELMKEYNMSYMDALFSQFHKHNELGEFIYNEKDVKQMLELYAKHDLSAFRDWYNNKTEMYSLNIEAHHIEDYLITKEE